MEGIEKQSYKLSSPDETEAQFGSENSEKFDQLMSNFELSLVAGLTFFLSNYNYLDLAADGEREFSPEGEKVVRLLLEKVGLPYERIMQSWLAASYDINLRPDELPHEAAYHDRSIEFNSLNTVAYVNLTRILEVECEQLGAAKYLHSHCGLANFARFPLELLLQQYEQSEDLGTYGIYVVTAFDPNGVMTQAGNIASSVNAQLPANVILRLVEVRGKFEMASKLLRFQSRYGQAGSNKVNFLILDAHGTQESIRTGLAGDGESGAKQTKLESLDSLDVLSDNFKRLGGLLLHPGADVLLLSCSTGARQGIAETAARNLNCRIIAPTDDIQAAEIKVEVADSGEIRLNPTYSGAEVVVYEPS